jgi:hypothetical protein
MGEKNSLTQKISPNPFLERVSKKLSPNSLTQNSPTGVMGDGNWLKGEIG